MGSSLPHFTLVYLECCLTFEKQQRRNKGMGNGESFVLFLMKKYNFSFNFPPPFCLDMPRGVNILAKGICNCVNKHSASHSNLVV